LVPPEAFRRAVEAGTRTATGVPGPRYWTQWADYRLSARLDTRSKRLTGSGRITYHNRSPDTLSVVYLHLYHNLAAPGAVRNDVAEDPAGGVTLTRLAAQGRTLREGEGYRVGGTTLEVRLPRPLAPGDTLPIEAEWWFPIAQNLAERTGWSRDNLFFLAYWYPQMAVYDDVAGWHTDQHLGQGEFYAGFARYDVVVDAPEGWVVTATGELVNEAEVLPPAVIERLRRARGSDSVVHVLTAADLGPGRATRDVPGDRLRWRFRADSVRDFTFGASRESLWDALRAPAGDRDGDGRPEHTLAQALYRAPAAHWANAAGFVREGLEFGARFNGLPYPWPHMTVMETEDIIFGGMEYPMLAIVRAFPDTSGDPRRYGETIHEVLHSWVPMLVSTDETRYGWLDEGLTGFAEANATAPRFPHLEPQMAADQKRYLELARSGAEGEIMRWTDYHYTLRAFSIATYQKPNSVLFALRTLLGEEAFRRGWQGFIASWAYRQPTPWDFFNAMEAAAGRDLDWFWSAWYHTTWTLDHAVAVTQQGAETVVEVRDLGGVPMPARLRITRESGETLEREVPVETWLGGARAATVRVPAGSPVVRVELDPTGTFPDIDRHNNVWTRGGG
ncbi:MAG TPA: M1 family metallopeptidase, partial [Longimicrobiaceae bacterium]|nr:M1 family metallopeptidase [Longimicrobiaceae bacterium]